MSPIALPRPNTAGRAAFAVAGVAAAVAAALGSSLATGLALVWLSHCLLDRAMGFGLRAADGSQRA